MMTVCAGFGTFRCGLAFFPDCGKSTCRGCGAGGVGGGFRWWVAAAIFLLGFGRSDTGVVLASGPSVRPLSEVSFRAVAAEQFDADRFPSQAIWLAVQKTHAVRWPVCLCGRSSEARHWKCRLSSTFRRLPDPSPARRAPPPFSCSHLGLQPSPVASSLPVPAQAARKIAAPPDSASGRLGRPAVGFGGFRRADPRFLHQVSAGVPWAPFAPSGFRLFRPDTWAFLGGAMRAHGGDTPANNAP